MESQEVDLKKTVNLPKTDFPMKANLPQNEPKLLERWKQGDIYGQIREARAGRVRSTFCMTDLRTRTAISIWDTRSTKLLKDFIVQIEDDGRVTIRHTSPAGTATGCRSKSRSISELGSKKAKMSAAEIRARMPQIRREVRQSAARGFHPPRHLRRLGRSLSAQWTPEYQATIAGAFVDFLDQGYVYKGLKPVNWCIHDRTALAEAEVEYENHTSPSIWVRFALASDPAAIDPALAGRKVYGLIWTTTPWTIPANMAIAFHPKFEYVAADVDGDVYIVARDLLNATAENVGWDEPQVLATFRGLEAGRRGVPPSVPGARFGRHSCAITSRWSKALERSTPPRATARKTTSSARKYNINTYCPVDAAGRFFHAEGADGTAAR